MLMQQSRLCLAIHSLNLTFKPSELMLYLCPLVYHLSFIVDIIKHTVYLAAEKIF